jgi:hypothetical protein
LIKDISPALALSGVFKGLGDHQIGGIGNFRRLRRDALEDVVRERDVVPANGEIIRLPNDKRELLLARFEELMCQLPEEARAA